ncbi:hypothetical protein M011DRAFT_495380 [Sporormia fimetaria CBS 119925]|uniref:Uncharacterized protein n=1 Tax=Sporormia fimetaria CBS 119925 TaxID=1340428 RepID=A0A6A6V9C9_9PLEO|nr:hypothetical protein M011DRAFT_495380 [Sporormia fimetaria CBS 119925]
MVELQPQPASEFTRLRPKTRRIAVQDIQEWPEMSSSVLEQVSVVLKHAKDKTALSRRDPKRREEADNVLGASVRRLERFLAKARMPPQAKAHQFDLNHLAAINERVFSELTEARHRSEDLEEQVRLANKRLQEELSRLEYVENNARDWRSRWKSRDNRQLHPLLRQSDSGADADDRPEDIGMRITEPTEPSLLETPDTELAPLLERLRRNLETMQGNQAQVDGISEATTRAQMALDDVLLRHGSAR